MKVPTSDWRPTGKDVLRMLREALGADLARLGLTRISGVAGEFYYASTEPVERTGVFKAVRAEADMRAWALGHGGALTLELILTADPRSYRGWGMERLSAVLGPCALRDEMVVTRDRIIGEWDSAEVGLTPIGLGQPENYYGDVWMPFRTAAHLETWFAFLARALPSAVRRLDNASLAPDGRAIVWRNDAD